jgi:hypothetical protein
MECQATPLCDRVDDGGLMRSPHTITGFNFWLVAEKPGLRSENARPGMTGGPVLKVEPIVGQVASAASYLTNLLP